MRILGAIELGGTKTVCGICTPDGRLLSRTSFPTTKPLETCEHALRFISEQSDIHGDPSGIGVGSFGPILLDRSSPRLGEIQNTPKTDWQSTNLIELFGSLTRLPIAIDTDVNCALRAEAEWGAGMGHSDLVYVTVGTGIGGGIMHNGKVVSGPLHPEIGHMLIPRRGDDLEFTGACPFHDGGCAEGLAAGPAIEKRWGKPATDLAAKHPAWDLEAHYLAVLCVNLLLTASPTRIIMGGGVLQQSQLIAGIRDHFTKLLNEYLDVSALADSVDQLIVRPGLGNDSGVLGATVAALEHCS